MTFDPQKLRELTADWDSYGGRRPTEAAIRTAENLEVVPMSHGGCQLELHAGGSEIEVEIGDDGTVLAVTWSLSPDQKQEDT